MENQHIKSILVIALIFAMLMGHSNASFAGCYAKCFIPCLIGGNAVLCGIKCVPQCIGKKTSAQDITKDTDYFCRLGCASTLCTQLSTEQDPGW